MKVVVNDLAVEYRDQGKGGAILLLHGWKSTQEVFNDLGAELVKDHRVISVDLPGFGASEIPATDWGIDEYVEFLQQFLNKINSQKLKAVVAHSMGASIAIKAIAKNKIKADKLVLIGAAGIRHPKSLRNRVYKILAKGGRVLLSALPKTKRERLRKLFYKKIGSDYAEAGAMKNTFIKLVGEDVKSFAGRLNLPTLLIYGSDDHATPVWYGQLLHSLITGSKLEVIPGAGHFVFTDQPALTQKVITDFLK